MPKRGTFDDNSRLDNSQSRSDSRSRAGVYSRDYLSLKSFYLNRIPQPMRSRDQERSRGSARRSVRFEFTSYRILSSRYARGREREQDGDGQYRPLSRSRDSRFLSRSLGRASDSRRHRFYPTATSAGSQRQVPPPRQLVTARTGGWGRGKGGGGGGGGGKGGRRTAERTGKVGGYGRDACNK